MVLATTDFCFTIPLATWGIVENVVGCNVQPWISWANIHSDYSQIPQVTRASLSRLDIYSFEITRWGAVLCAFVFFGFFGLTSEARKNYRLLASAVTEHLGITIFAEVAVSSEPHVQSLQFASAPASLQSATQLSTWSQTSSMIPSIEKVMQVPDAILDPTSVKRVSISGTPILVYVGNGPD
jgi:hypothetical protein